MRPAEGREVPGRLTLAQRERGSVTARRLEHADVVADIGQEIAGLVRNGEAGQEARNAGAIELPAQNPEHQVRRRLVDERAALHLLEQQAELTRLKAERAVWERRVSLLRSDKIDPDMLDEQARALLGYVDPRDITLLLHPRE